MDRGAWWATVHVVAESDTTEATNTFTFTFNHCIGGWVLNHWTTRVVTVCHFLNFCFKMLYKSNHNSTLFGLAFSLSIVPRRFIQVLVCVFWVTAHVCTSLLNYSLVDKVVSRFLLLLTMLLWTFMYRFCSVFNLPMLVILNWPPDHCHQPAPCLFTTPSATFAADTILNTAAGVAGIRSVVCLPWVGGW